MRRVTLGSTGIAVAQDGFGALPMQRVTKQAAVRLLERAYDGGMRYFDTARAYSDSEEKLGVAFRGKWGRVFIASKTMAATPEGFRKDLETSLRTLGTDCIDVYQFHNISSCRRPGDGTGMYECMLEAKRQGKIRHIGMTSHKIGVALECAKSRLYETVQFPFSYLSSERELELVRRCRENNVGFIAMKALAGGLVTRSEAAMAFMSQIDNVVPIWGIQRENELEEWLSYMEDTPAMTPELAAFIEREKEELSGDFCRGCGYCMPCTVGIEINSCARMSLMIRRSPSARLLSSANQAKMKKIEECVNCGKCAVRCPYELNTPALLRKNYKDYKRILSGEVKVTRAGER